jgi:hypothetical protein
MDPRRTFSSSGHLPSLLCNAQFWWFARRQVALNTASKCPGGFDDSCCEFAALSRTRSLSLVTREGGFLSRLEGAPSNAVGSGR